VIKGVKGLNVILGLNFAHVTPGQFWDRLNTVSFQRSNCILTIFKVSGINPNGSFREQPLLE